MCSERSALAGRVEWLEEVLGWRNGLQMTVAVCLSPHRLGDSVGTYGGGFGSVGPKGPGFHGNSLNPDLPQLAWGF